MGTGGMLKSYKHMASYVYSEITKFKHFDF